MPTPVRVCVCVLFLGLAAGLSPAAPPDPPARPAVVNRAALAQDLGAAIARVPRVLPRGPSPLALLDLADGLTWRPVAQSGAASRPVVAGAHWVVTFRVPDVTEEATWANTVLGAEVPGTRVRHEVHVDCLVHAWAAAAGPAFRWDPAAPTRLVVRLPAFERFTGEIPEGAEPRFVTDFGRLKPTWWYADAAADQRQGLYQKAKERAKVAVEAEVAADRAGVAAALAEELGRAVPQYRPAAFADAQGSGLVLADYFPPPEPAAPAAAPPPADRGGDGGSVGWAAAAGAVLAVLAVAVGLVVKRRVRA